MYLNVSVLLSLLPSLRVETGERVSDLVFIEEGDTDRCGRTGSVPVVPGCPWQHSGGV